MVTFTLEVAFRQAKDLKGVQHEVQLAQNIANQVFIRVLRVKEVVAGWVLDFELVKPNVKELLAGFLGGKLLVKLLVVNHVLDLLVDLIRVLN